MANRKDLIDLIKQISDAVIIPVIASSGAGAVEHFSEVFKETNASAALAAGIFHRKEVPIQSVKEHLLETGVEVRMWYNKRWDSLHSRVLIYIIKVHLPFFICHVQ